VCPLVFCVQVVFGRVSLNGSGTNPIIGTYTGRERIEGALLLVGLDGIIEFPPG